MPKYLSGRSKLTPQSDLKSNRYRYLSIENAEPNLGDPLVGLSSVLGKPVPPGQQYIVVSVEGSESGERYWIPNQGGIIPGSISVFDDSTLVGTLSSITQLDFVGAAITVSSTIESVNLATIKVFSPGNNQEILFNTLDEFSTSTKLKFDTSDGLLSAGDRIIVGAGGTVITTTTNGLVGINTNSPTQELHVQGDLRLTGTIYDSLNNPGNTGDLIVKTFDGGIIWVNPRSTITGAGGTVGQIQFHNSAGLVGGASNFYFDFTNNRIGIGSTQPKVLLDVLGISNFKGGTIIDNLNVTGVTTTLTLAVSGTSTTRNLLVTGIATIANVNIDAGEIDVTRIETQNLRVIGVSTVGFITGTNAFFTGIVTASKLVGAVDVSNLYVTGISTFLQKVNINSNLGVTGLTTTQNLQVYQSTTLNRLNVSGVSTFSSQVNINNLNVTGVGIFDNIKIYDNNIETTFGNLIIDSDAGITQINDSVYVNDVTESTSKNTGAIIVEGGVGIEKNLYVGGQVNLATSGGITTTGGDLYIGGDLYVLDDVYYDELFARNGYFSGIVSTKDLNVTGIATIAKLDVNGETTTNTLKVLSTSTFNGNVTLGDNNADLVTFNSRINSFVLPSTNGTLDLGGINNKWNNVYANTFYGQFNGNADTATKLLNARNIAITGDLSWNVNFDGSANVTSVGTLANSGVVANTYGSSTTVPVFSVDAKGRVTSVTDTGINFSNATVANADNIRTTSNTSVDTSFFPTFVDSNNNVAAYEALFTDANISYNPFSNLLSLTNLTVSGTSTFNGNVTLGDNNADLVTFNSRINSFVLPSTNGTLDLGGINNKWNNVYANTFSGQFIGNADTATTATFLNTASSSTDRDNITTRLNSGFWESSSATTAEGWPLSTNSWQHLISVTHSNPNNYYALQLAAPFYTQNLYYRSTNGNGSTAWNEILTSANVSTMANNGITIQEEGFTVGEILATRIVNFVGNSVTATSPTSGTATITVIPRTSDGTTIDTIQSTANSASSTAAAAQSTANNAASTAAAAQSTANSAQSTANSASSTAAAAQSTANSASSTANSASSTAAAAQSTANSASSTAAAAQSTANSAQSTANSASSTAAAAQSTANNAASTAAAAQSTANNAVQSTQSSNQVLTQSNTTNADYFVTFVDSNNGSATSQTIYTDADISYNPSTNLLKISGAVRIGAANLSSGGDYAHLATYEYYNGSSWVYSSATAGGLYQITGQAHNWYKHNGAGTHTTLLTLDASGNLVASANVTAYSDIKLKENINTIENALDKTLKLRGVTFTRKDIPEEGIQIGVIAQEVEEIIPEAVKLNIIETPEGTVDEVKTVAYGNMVGLLIEAIKEQQKTIEKLEKRIEDLENK